MPDEQIAETQHSVLPEPEPSPALTEDQVAELRGFKVSGFDKPEGGETADLTSKEGREKTQKLIRDLRHGVETLGRTRNERITAMEKALTDAGYDPKTLKRRETPQPPTPPAAAVTEDSVYAEMLKDAKIKAMVDDTPEMESVFRRQAALEARLSAGVKSEKPDDERLTAADVEVMLDWNASSANPDYKRLAIEIGKRDFNADDEFKQFEVGDDSLRELHAAACKQRGEYIPVTKFLSEMSKRLLTAPVQNPPSPAPVVVAPPGGPQPAPAPGRPGAPAPAGPAPLEQVANMTDAQWAERQRTRFGASTEDQAFSLGGSDRRDGILGGK